jgi:hypothetical protein
MELRTIVLDVLRTNPNYAFRPDEVVQAVAKRLERDIWAILNDLHHKKQIDRKVRGRNSHGLYKFAKLRRIGFLMDPDNVARETATVDRPEVIVAR